MIFAQLFFCAEAEEAILGQIDTAALEEFAAEQGFDWSEWFQTILTGDQSLYDGLKQLWKDGTHLFFRDAETVAVRMTAVMLVSAVMKIFMDGSSSIKRTSMFLCRAAGAAVLCEAYLSVSVMAKALLRQAARCSDLLAPVLAAAMTLSGSEITAGFLTPMMGTAADLMVDGLETWGLAMCTAAACAAIAGHLSEAFSLNRMHRFFKQMLYWGMGLMMTGFMGVLTIQGKLAQGRDSAASRTAHYAIESLIPVIGGNMSDSLETMLSTAMNVKNAIGASGLALLLRMCLSPMIRMAGMMFLLKLLSAMFEPLGDSGMSDMAGQFADAAEMALVTALMGVMLCGLLVGSFISAAQGGVR